MNEDILIHKLLQHDGKLDRIEERLTHIESKLEMLDTIAASQDKVVKFLQDMKTEQATNIHKNNRFEERLETVEADMKQVKRHLQIA